MSDNLKTWPERIYMQNTDEGEPMIYSEAMRHEDAVTWCDVRQEQGDVEYVRADVMEQRIAELEEENAALSAQNIRFADKLAKIDAALNDA